VSEELAAACCPADVRWQAVFVAVGSTPPAGTRSTKRPLQRLHAEWAGVRMQGPLRGPACACDAAQSSGACMRSR
jgi:hypothetical protein